jgi:hypothetical protein
MSNDSDLRQRFASLRREDAGRAASFSRVLHRPPRSSSRDRGLLAATACLALVVLALVLYPRARAPRPPDAAAPSLADWRSPTEFLLNTPGREMLRTVPAIGETPDMLGVFPHLNDTTPAHRVGREHS